MIEGKIDLVKQLKIIKKKFNDQGLDVWDMMLEVLQLGCDVGLDIARGDEEFLIDTINDMSEELRIEYQDGIIKIFKRF